MSDIHWSAWVCHQGRWFGKWSVELEMTQLTITPQRSETITNKRNEIMAKIITVDARTIWRFCDKLSNQAGFISSLHILEPYRTTFNCLLHPLSLVTSLGCDKWAIMGVFCYVLFYSKIWNHSILAVILWNNNYRFERSKYKPGHVEWKRLYDVCVFKKFAYTLLI